MQHPRGVAVLMGLGIALGVLVILIVGVVYYGAQKQSSAANQNQAANANVDNVVKLNCSQASECAAYCGLEATYTPFCDSTKHCACSFTGDPLPANNRNSSTAVTDFASCVAAGNPVQESYPRKCSVGGATFTEVLTNSNVNAAKNTNQSTNTNVSTTGWKTYTSDTTYVSENLEGFESNCAEKISYSIKYPSSWTLRGTVFDDENSKKIAELSPGAVYFDNTQNCAKLPPPDPNGWPVVELSREKIAFGTLSGVKIVSKSAVEGDNSPYWYPNRYCLESGNKAFLISFYENELGKGDRRLFDRILSTFTFTK